MTLTSILSELDLKTLNKMLNSQKDYFLFKISVFNAGTVIQVICTNKYKEFGHNWNGYDFIIENDDTTKYYIEEAKKEIRKKTDKIVSDYKNNHKY